MKTVFDACQPRESIIQGTFNPEIFTAALGPVISYYHRQSDTAIDTIYTDAEAFFRDATYPTDGLRTTLRSVFSRIAGDASVPSIYRLETAFGGGKTHTLIACTHIAYRGTELADVTRDILAPELLPVPGTVGVVGIAGDELPVQRTHGDQLVPYTLWGDMAYQIGGEELYHAVQTTHGSRLVTAYEDLAGLELSETPLASEDIARARQELTHLAMHEADVLRTVQKVLEQNARQALLQASLTRDVAIALLEKAAQEGYEKYKSARAELASHARKSYPLTLPAHLYAGNEERLLFPVVLHGDNVHISAPPILWQAALALCDRISSDLKSGKNRRKIKYADQTCEDILSRLRRKQEANR